MEPISIRYRLSEAEFMAACNAHWSARHQGSLVNLIAGGVGIVLGLVLLGYAYRWGGFLVWLGILLQLITGLRSWLWRRAFRETKKFTDEIAVVFQEDSIHVESTEGKSDLNWSFYTWYLEAPGQVLLYTTKRHFSVIPKPAFPDAASLARFLELVGKKLKKF